MSKTEILEELPKLTSEERHEIRLKLAELDGDGWLDDDDPLTDEEKALIESRLEDHEKNPESAVPWEEVKARSEVRGQRSEVGSQNEPEPSQPISEDEVEQILLAEGIISGIPPRLPDEDEESYDPIEVPGKPLSETIIEERR